MKRNSAVVPRGIMSLLSAIETSRIFLFFFINYGPRGRVIEIIQKNGARSCLGRLAPPYICICDFNVLKVAKWFCDCPANVLSLPPHLLCTRCPSPIFVGFLLNPGPFYSPS